MADAAPPGRQPPEPTEWKVSCPFEGEFTVANGWRTFRTSFLGDAEWLRDRLRAASGGAPQTFADVLPQEKLSPEASAILHDVVMSKTRPVRASGAAAPPQLGDPGRGSFERGVTCWVCPDCAFTFDAGHTDQSANTYTCPLCYPAAPPQTCRRHVEGVTPAHPGYTCSLPVGHEGKHDYSGAAPPAGTGGLADAVTR